MGLRPGEIMERSATRCSLMKVSGILFWLLLESSHFHSWLGLNLRDVSLFQDYDLQLSLLIQNTGCGITQFPTGTACLRTASFSTIRVVANHGGFSTI